MKPLAAFALVVGPREKRIAIDTLNSAKRHHPGVDFWILDDCTQDGTYEGLQEWVSDNGGHLLRNAKAHGYALSVRSTYHLYSAILRSGVSYDFIVKFDPDTYFLRSGLVAHYQTLFNRYGPGVIGAYRFSPDGSRRDYSRMRRRILLDLLPIGRGDNPSYLRIGPAFYTKYVLKALAKGYEFGEHAQGGLYAVHRDTLARLSQIGFLDAVPERIEQRLMWEDVLLGIGVKSIGHQLIDVNQEPHPTITWIRYKSPLQITAEVLRERAVAAIHPVKDEPHGNALREALRAEG